MVICIAFAESTLGRFLSTNNNIGNVGNNDRGDRIAYSNPYNGARLIPLTLNNQYLGNYHTIKQKLYPLLYRKNYNPHYTN